MAKKVKKEVSAPFELLVLREQANDVFCDTHFSAHASKSIEDLVVANEDDPESTDIHDREVIEVAVYHFVGVEQYKKSKYARVSE